MTPSFPKNEVPGNPGAIQSAADTALREELRYAIQFAQEAEEEVVAARDLVDARQSVVAQVELDVSRLNRSSAALEQLSPFRFLACPRCMQSLSARHIAEGHCVVCLQPDPAEADIDPAAIEETRAVLRQQLADAQHIKQSDITNLHAAHQHAQQTSFLVSSLRRELDAQSRDVVAPRFDAIADASSRVATLKASIDAVTQLRDSWSRVRAIEANIREIKKTRRQTNRDIKDMSQKLAARQATVINELSESFGDLLRNWNLPWVNTAVIDNDSYLPIVNGQPLESQQASGGGIATSINVAYSLTLLKFGLDHPEILTPSLLIIDSPRKAFGNNDSDRERAAQIYDRFRTLATTYGKQLQLIIADNDPPPISSGSFGKVEFTYEDPMVPGVVHPGPDLVVRIGEEQDN